MSNKRYDEFPAGTYDTAKIFLQGDPVTGALEKVNLPTITPGIIMLESIITSAGSAAGVATSLHSFVIPANTMANNGDVLQFHWAGLANTEPGSRSFAMRFNASSNTFSLGNSTNSWFLTAVAARLTSSTMWLTGTMQQGNFISLLWGVEQTGINWAASNTFELRVNATTANSIVAKASHVNYQPV